MAIMFGGFGFQTVMERTTKAKHIQFVSGACVLTYWLSALLCDLICFSILCCLFLGVFKYCEVDYLVEDYHFLDTMMIFMLYGWSVVPLMYLGSFLFSSSAAAFVKLTLFNYVSTSISITNKILRQLPIFYIAYFCNLKCILNLYFLTFAVILDFVSIFKVRLSLLSSSVLENNIYSFGERGIAKFLITLAALGLFYLLLLFFLETAFWRLKIFVFQKIIFNVYNIFVKGKKIYFKCPAIRAVRNISLVVKKSECFGLLGLNGAGKTSIFKISTGDVPATSGKVFIDGISITENVRSRIGYCPQSDPVLGHMTGRELLIMYARLRGVPEPHIYEYVETFLHSVHLEPHADKFMYTYSGANKRRLTTAAALMGKSSVVFLDEPSLGMDLMARRLLWDTVTLMCKTGKAIVITSHSMEECEALCTRLAIMVKGRFNCLGSPQHLKNKFSDVYTLTAKIKMDKGEDRLEKFKEFIASTFPGSIITQEHQGIIDYHIPRKEICWGKAVSVLEETKALFKLEDYSISQITLEQVFLTIANIDKMESSQEIKL
uniref:ABC transporter domain-containing protein n=1 Tax=Rhinolophus ferrumequinum TaxID=59479 RepID=A0A671G659_RHIFE